MSAIDRFLLVARTYRQVTDLKTTALSWRLFGDSKKLGALESGADIQVTRYERGLQWFSDHWPEGAIWPVDVPRPAPVPVSAISRMSVAPAEASAA